MLFQRFFVQSCFFLGKYLLEAYEVSDNVSETLGGKKMGIERKKGARLPYNGNH